MFARPRKVTELTLGVYDVDIERKLDHFKEGVGMCWGWLRAWAWFGLGVRVGVGGARRRKMEMTELTLGVYGNEKGTLAGAFETKMLNVTD